MKIEILKKKIRKFSKLISYKQDLELNKKHSRDWRNRYSNISLGVIFPKTTKELSKIIKFAQKENIKLIPQGGNTGLVGGTSPFQNKKEIIINFEKLNKIIDIDKDNNCVEVESGIIIDNLALELKKYGYLFPLNMSSTGSSQVGGAIATNAGGINVVKYGSIRNNILGLEVVLSNGEILNIGSRLIKDNTGYNLKDIFCGSEGTLGFITKAIIKIYPIPKDDINCFIAFENFSEVIKTYNLIYKSFRDNIDSLEFISQLSFDLCIKHKLIKKSFFNKKYKYYLLIKFTFFDHKDNFLEKFYYTLENFSNNYKEFLIAQNEDQKLQFWNFRELLTEAQKIEGKLIGFDISLPINFMGEFMHKVKKEVNYIVPKTKFHVFGHLGDSNLHFNLIEPDNLKNNFYDYEKQIKSIINKYLKLFKGSVRAEHGIGLLKKDDLLHTKSKAELRIMKKIKKLFDPKNIFNQKKII